MLSEPVPAHLVSLLRSAPAGSTPGRLLQFRSRPLPQRPWMQWGALAASFAFGALVWHFGSRLNSNGPINENHGEFVASGGLEKALDGQLVADQNPSAAVQIGVSFRSRQGSYCRTFRLRGTTGAAGLACHDNAAWTVQLLVHEGSAETLGQYRQAASDLPPAVLHAVDDSISGEPLDSSAEAQARASGWRARP